MFIWEEHWGKTKKTKLEMIGRIKYRTKHHRQRIWCWFIEQLQNEHYCKGLLLSKNRSNYPRVFKPYMFYIYNSYFYIKKEIGGSHNHSKF